MNVEAFREMQQWLNARGETLTVDGLPGPAYRAAILSVFTNRNAPPISSHDLVAIAGRLGDDGSRLTKVAKVEAAGSGWFDNGLPKILYERHKFWKLTSGQFGLTWFSNPKPGDYTIDANGNDVIDSWEKLTQAACRDPMAAFQSVSIGKFQVMGMHAVKLGYENAREMLWAAAQSEAAHYEMCARYIEHFGLKPAFLKLSNRPEDCAAFAAGYNGPGYRKFNYDVKLAKA